MLITDFEYLSKQFDKKAVVDSMNKKDLDLLNDKNDESIRNMSFSVNTITSEINFIKRVFKPENLAQIH